MYMEYKQFKFHLKNMAERGFSIQDSVAFRKPFMALDLYGCSEQLSVPLTAYMIGRLYRAFGMNISLMDLTEKNWNDLSMEVKLGPKTSEDMLTFFYEMSEETPFEFNVKDYYTSTDLSRIMNVPEEEMIRQLQLGRYKGAFIDQIGQWRKKKPKSPGNFS